MNKKGEYEDRELRTVFSSLERLRAPERAVRALYAKLDTERNTASPSHRNPLSFAFLRLKREVLVAVFATFIFAVPLTYWATKRFASENQAPRTYVVRFVYEDEDASTVNLLGDFNSWRKNEIVLERVEGTRLWAAEVSLQEGLYRYGFLVDGARIVSDPFAGVRLKDSLGNESSLVVLDGTQGNGGSL